MKRDFYNDFEKFLKESADQYRLYPTAKVWKGIHAALYSRRRWVGLGILLLLLTGTGVTLLITNSSKQKASSFVQAEPVIEQKNTPANSNYTFDLTNSIVNKTQPLTSNLSSSQSNAITNTTHYITSETLLKDIVATTTTPEGNAMVSIPPRPGAFSEVSKGTVVNNITLSSNTAVNFTSMVKDEDNDVTTKDKTTETSLLASNPNLDLTIESVLNSYKKSKAKKLNWHLNITPTISYRKLSENKQFLNSAAARANNYAYTPPIQDINNAVTHKPDMGLELGLTSKYSLNTSIKIISGLQFNVSRYDIKAFSRPLEVATIALNNGGRQVDSFRTITNYSNYNGYKSDWLHNLYFQVSVPIGAEVVVAGDDKIQLGVAGTIQPTYVLGNRAYLISTDYKNYARVSWLIRRWNVNTAFESFVSYSTGKLKWQVGPQVRYQLLSSFVKKYPVKENLFDFGLKVGIQLNK